MSSADDRHEDESSSRRDFLSGRAAARALARRGDALAESLLDEPTGFATGPTIRLEAQAMACPWSVVLNPSPPEDVMIASAALDMVHDVEAELTIFREDSEISRMNARAADAAQPVSLPVYELLTACRELSSATSGAFDPACLAMTRLWRQARSESRVPAADEIATALAVCGMKCLAWNDADRTVAFPAPGFGFDLGAIGKGYALDRIAARLAMAGLRDFLIHGGRSSIYAAGDHAGDGGWPVGLQNPVFLDEPYAVVLLRNQALGTSGSNVQFFRHDGRRFGHILDPRTGWPAEGLLSVTVLADSAARADALSTALYVMGLENARAWCQDHPEIGAILVPPPDQVGRLHPIFCGIPENRLLLKVSSRES